MSVNNHHYKAEGKMPNRVCLKTPEEGVIKFDGKNLGLGVRRAWVFFSSCAVNELCDLDPFVQLLLFVSLHVKRANSLVAFRAK